MNHRTVKSLTLSLMFVVPSVLWAQQDVDESREARPDARIEFTGVSGNFQFIGGDEERLHITGTLAEDVEEMTIEGEPGHWRVEIHYPRNYQSRGPRGPETELEVHLPAGAALDARAVSGGISLAGLNGPSVHAESVSGGVTATDTTPEHLSIETVSGSIRADGGGRAENRLQSVSGSIRVNGLGGRVDAESVSGNLEVSGDGIQALDAETVSGNIRADLDPADRARLNLQSHSGEIEVALPSATPLQVEAGTFSGSIDSAFGGQVQSGRGPGAELEHVRGDGNVRLEATSFSGGIRIRDRE